MLAKLRIRKLAIVADATIDLSPGLNVLTGSTGAGKSLILGAMNLLLGEKSSAELIRAGEDRAEVEAVFDDGVSARREIRRSGRSYAWIDGRPVPLRELAQAMALRVEPHGQNEQFRLRDPQNHVLYLDALAANAGEKNAYGESLAQLRARQAEEAEFERWLAAIREKRELLEHRLGEIERAKLVPGELERIDSELRVAAEGGRVFEALAGSCEALYDDDESALARVGHALRRIEPLSRLDPRIAEIVSCLTEVKATLVDCVDTMRDYVARAEFDPADMDRKQERAALLKSMERRYSRTIDELVLARTEWARELDSLDNADLRRQSLRTATAAATAAALTCADALSATRRRAAKTLDPRMSAELGELVMAGARFRTEIVGGAAAGMDVDAKGTPRRLGEDGADTVRFRVRSNPGEIEGPVDRIASSGEMSRIALALKHVTAAGRPGSVMVLDEIDAGIGADLGAVIAEKLLALAERFQIVCITHMPQIAAGASRHLVVEKSTVEGRVCVAVVPVDGEARAREIARMLGGESGSDHRIALAAELLRSSGPRSTRVRP